MIWTCKFFRITGLFVWICTGGFLAQKTNNAKFWFLAFVNFSQDKLLNKPPSGRWNETLERPYDVTLMCHSCMFWCSHGPFTRYVKLTGAHAPGTPGTFSSPPTSKETAGWRSRHASRHVRTHVPWCMSESLTRGGGESWRMRNPQFHISGKRHIPPCSPSNTHSRSRNGSPELILVMLIVPVVITFLLMMPLITRLNISIRKRATFYGNTFLGPRYVAIMRFTQFVLTVHLTVN